MRRLVIDTNLYVDWLNRGRHESVLFQSPAVRYLSAVVLMELLAGAFTARDRRLVRQVGKAFTAVRRVLVPTARVYEEAGEVLRRLQASRGYTLGGKHSVVNDVLIALSARAIGATVITRNARDFEAIEGIRPFALEVVT